MQRVEKKRYLLCLIGLLLTVALLHACAGMGTTGSKYMEERSYNVYSDTSLEQASQLAAEALQNMGMEITRENTAAGFLAAKKVFGFWVNKQTMFMEVHLSMPSSGTVKAHAISIAGPEIAFTDELDNYVRNFYKEYEKALARVR